MRLQYVREGPRVQLFFVESRRRGGGVRKRRMYGVLGAVVRRDADNVL